MFRIGEKPGKGTYICTVCGKEIVLNDDNDTLPPCSLCHCTNWEKA